MAYRSETFTSNTKKTYQSHLNSYLQFCGHLQILPVPVTEHTVTLYAAYLARRLAPSSVRQYLNIIRILHLESGLPHPFADSWLVKTTLRGIEKVKGKTIKRKAPVTPTILLGIKQRLNLSDHCDAIFWAACLVLFFGMLRKSNLFQDTGAFDPTKQLTRDCFIACANAGLTIVVSWTKTIQCKERKLRIFLPIMPNHPLCPVTAVISMFRLIPPSTPNCQAFPIKGSEFNKRVRALTAVEEGDFSSHSFRRGGATWALSCGVPGEVVKAMGDWQSTAYLSYLDQIPQTVLDQYRKLLVGRAPLS